MNVLDLCILAIICGFSILGFWRGLIKEITETIGAIVSMYFSYLLYEPILTSLEINDDSGWIKKTLIFLLIFITLMIIITILGSLVRKFIKSVSLGMYDHMLGLISGALKGGIIVTILLSLAVWIGPPIDQKVSESKIARASLLTFDFLIEFMPESIQQSRLAELRLPLDSLHIRKVKNNLFDLYPLTQALYDSSLTTRLQNIPSLGSAISKLKLIVARDSVLNGIVHQLASPTEEGAVEYLIGDSVFRVPWFVGSLKEKSITASEFAIGDNVRFALSYSRLLDRLCVVDMEKIETK